jgi:hypothetical protein
MLSLRIACISRMRCEHIKPHLKALVIMQIAVSLAYAQKLPWPQTLDLQHSILRGLS